jgi:hypothetical protein
VGTQQTQIIKIPISKLMPNDDQPRRMFRPGNIQEMAESLKAIGQQTPLKVRLLTADEKATPRRDMFTHDELVPREVPGELGFEYLVIGGHRRLAGAKLAGFETLDCIVMDMKPEDTHLASLMDNVTEDMSWWDWDLAIEKEHLAFPNLSHRQLAKRLGKSKGKIGNALLLTKVLDEHSRGSIDLNLDKAYLPGDFKALPPDEDLDDADDADPKQGKNPLKTHGAQPLGTQEADYQITESILLALVPLEDPIYISCTLDIIIDNEMTEVQAKKIIQWVYDGNEPEDFDLQAAFQDKPKEIDPMAEAWKGLGPQIKVKYKGGEDYEIRISVTGGQKALKTAQAAQKALQGGILTAILNA